MSSERGKAGDDKANRWRPRFSIRTLVVVVTLVCVYFGAWEATKTRGVADVGDRLTRENNGYPVTPHIKAPLLLEFSIHHIHGPSGQPPMDVVDSRYYFWFFGYVAKLPYEGKQTHPMLPSS